MIAVEEALDRILFHIHPLGSEKVSLLEALGRVIAEDVYADRDIPPFDNSGMDGYAVRSEDIRDANQNSKYKIKCFGHWRLKFRKLFGICNLGFGI